LRDGSFGKWLEGARDWSISRNRFWGSPIPVWQSDDPRYPRTDVYGSLDELERDFGVRPTDLHRPAIDNLTRPNPDDPTGRSTMRRTEDVLDCWFESGSMPFAQVHYPFENQDWFESHFPGDFIVEYIGQTRGWFYTLHVLATALFDKPAFSTCVVHGVLLGNDGQKLSKRLKNYPDPVEVFDTLGSDAMRWALLSSAAVRGGDMVADRRPMEEARRQVLMPMWNAWHFLSLYANAAGVGGTGSFASANVLDRYVAAKLHDLVVEVTTRMDAYDLSGSCAAVQQFLDSLTNWYIRRSRERFWAGDPEAVATLHATLAVLCRTVAPLLPLLADHVYDGLEPAAGSVHLADWPSAGEVSADAELVAAMDAAREVCSAAASIRKAAGRNNRQPLATLTVAGVAPDAIERFGELIAAEVNVKSLVVGSVQDIAEERVEVNLKVVGRTLGKDTPAVVAAMKAGDYTYDAANGTLTAAGHAFTGDQFTRRLVPHDESASRALPGDAGVVRLDLDLTPELEQEGLARLLVRLVNNARRDAGLHVSDRIHLVIDPLDHADVAQAVTAYKDMLSREVLARDIVLGDRLAEYHRAELGDGRAVHLGFHVTKAG
jgi:isoleucyl-tRNA synthetase